MRGPADVSGPNWLIAVADLPFDLLSFAAVALRHGSLME